MFKAFNTQFLSVSFSLSKTPYNFPVSFDDSLVPPLNAIIIIGINVIPGLSWTPHITKISNFTSGKLDLNHMLVWRTALASGEGLSPKYVLSKVESRAIRLITLGKQPSKLDRLSMHRTVGSLSLIYRYHFGLCFRQLAACIPPLLATSHII